MRLEHLRDVAVNMVRADTPDLTLRQLAGLLTVATGGTNTVRGLAAALNVSKPAVTRSLDRLEELVYVRRVIDPTDRRLCMDHRVLTNLVDRDDTDMLAALRGAAQRVRDVQNFGHLADAA